MCTVGGGMDLHTLVCDPPIIREEEEQTINTEEEKEAGWLTKEKSSKLVTDTLHSGCFSFFRFFFLTFSVEIYSFV